MRIAPRTICWYCESTPEQDDPVEQAGQEDRGDERVLDPASAALEPGTAEDDGGQDREQGVRAEVRLRLGHPGDEDDPAQAGQRPGDDEDDDPQAVHADARPEGRLAVVAGQVDVHPERGPVEDEPADAVADEQDDDRDRDRADVTRR